VRPSHRSSRGASSRGDEALDDPVTGGSDIVRRDADGTVMLDTRAASEPLGASMTLLSAPMPPHSVENVGEAELSVIVVELKDPAARPPG
jgi:hypothetical protein